MRADTSAEMLHECVGASLAGPSTAKRHRLSQQEKPEENAVEGTWACEPEKNSSQMCGSTGAETWQMRAQRRS
eukprot:6174505-Pleurochrysis_carterae.AAC.5